MSYIEALLAANLLFPNVGDYATTENEESTIVAEASEVTATTSVDEGSEENTDVCFRPLECMQKGAVSEEQSSDAVLLPTSTAENSAV